MNIDKKYKVVFLGTGWESVRVLDRLNNSSHFDVVCSITSPDKPVGRKQVMTPSAVKTYCLENGIDVVHTEKNKDKYMEVVKTYNPDICVCIAFGEIVPEEFLNYPKYKCINIHFSLLPKYRGAVPIQKAILEGDNETGVCYIIMGKELDDGPIISSFTERILPKDTNLTLRERLVDESADRLEDVLLGFINGDLSPVEQMDGATYCWQKDIAKEKAEIIWEDMEPIYIDRMVRAFSPWPIAWSKINLLVDNPLSKETVKLYDIDILDVNHNGIPAGTMFTKDNMVLIATRDIDKCVRLNSFQISGKKQITEKEFLNGIGRFLK